MNSFSVVAFGFCLLALASGATTPTPALEVVENILEGKATPDALCEPVCGASCQVLIQTCVDIPGLTDCQTQIAACAARCNQLCGCLHQCPTGCAEDCSASQDFIEQVFCHNRVTTCNGICQIHCPIDVFTKEIMASIMKIVAGLKSLIAGAGGQPAP